MKYFNNIYEILFRIVCILYDLYFAQHDGEKVGTSTLIQINELNSMLCKEHWDGDL